MFKLIVFFGVKNGFYSSLGLIPVACYDLSMRNDQKIRLENRRIPRSLLRLGSRFLGFSHLFLHQKQLFLGTVSKSNGFLFFF